MKHKRSKYDAQTVFGFVIGGIVVVILSPLLVLIIIGVVVWQLLKFYFVDYPAFVKLEAQPHYWLNWREVRALTGLNTRQTGAFLALLSQAGLLEHKFRDQATFARLKRHYRVSAPPRESSEVMSNRIIFYEFRVVANGGKPSRATLLRARIPSMAHA
jgi:hypothetical protein